MEYSKHWEQIIQDFKNSLNSYCARIGEYPQINQIKEKFGQLRIYLEWTDDYVDKLVETAVNKCNNICENCGSNKSVELRQENGWYKTMCSFCFNTLNKNND